MSASESKVFSVSLSYQGKSIALDHVTATTTGQELHSRALQTLQLSPEETTLKLLYQGKRILEEETPAFAKAPSKKAPKILVMASPKTVVEELNAKKQDPTIRGFEQDRIASSKGETTTTKNTFWGDIVPQPKKYKVGRLAECTFHSFGHRPSDSTPHAFAARQLLEKLSTDPGIIAILEERELTVNTLGEMDPIDDRLMQKKQQQSPGSCLLGYNTNHGLRIDIKLRTDDLKTFRPYPELVSTLVHELSHNWVGEHNLLFWANFGQMRVEYYLAHKRLQSAVYEGRTSAEIAGLDSSMLNHTLDYVRQELQKDMAQHGLHPDMIADPIRQRYEELQSSLGQKLGGSGNSRMIDTAASSGRNLALEAAERRAREQQQQRRQNEDDKDEEDSK